MRLAHLRCTITSCPFCQLGNELRPMLEYIKGWLRCEGFEPQRHTAEPDSKRACPKCFFVVHSFHIDRRNPAIDGVRGNRGWRRQDFLGTFERREPIYVLWIAIPKPKTIGWDAVARHKKQNPNPSTKERSSPELRFASSPARL